MRSKIERLGNPLQRSVAVFAFLAALATLRAEPPAKVSDGVPAAIVIHPKDLRIATRRDRQSIVVQAQYADGFTRDVTAEAKMALENPALVRLEGANLHPASDGTTTLHVEFGGRKDSTSVTVKDAAAERPISFKLDVMPVFMKAGCNTGSCHGAARGKDGFRLSLFGFDPDGDYHRLTRELSGRRINLAVPHDSLIIEKALGKVPHTGGTRFPQESELYETLQRWLDAGAPADAAGLPTLTGLEVLPPSAVLDGAGSSQQLTVRARYSDAADRDVTSLAYFLSSNETSARVSPGGLITAGDRGEAFVLARFDTFSVGVQVLALPKGLEFAAEEVPEANFIDALVHRKLRKLRLRPSELSSDETFLRRVTIDITGMLPTAEEYKRFLERKEPDKRALLVDELLERKEFIELWVMKWAELLQIRSSDRVSYKAMLLYYNWLQERLQKNVPMDVLVRELLGASGGTFTNAATNYYQAETDTLKVAENVAQVFMGMRIQCAQCHNHPFDRWTQNDYYGFAAFFAQIGRKGAEDPRETVVFHSGSGEVTHPVGGRVMAPKFLGAPTPDLKGRDRCAALAEWLASPENPFFAANLANIVWAHFFGRGIIHPVDDVRVSNPPANPELLAELGRKFTEYRYDFKRLVRDICNSRTYQLATQTNETNKGDETNFSHATLRRIRAEVLLDCISEVTETKNKFQGLPPGARAVQIADGSSTNYFLTTFGRASRASVCSCEVKMEPNLSQALHLINGRTVEERIRSGKLLDRRLEEKKSPMEIVEELSIRCFSRRPTDAEKKKYEELFAAGGDVKRTLEDIFWAFLNSREFIFNH